MELLALGLRPFREVWDLQKKLQQGLINAQANDTLILCQHYPVVTNGRSGSEINLLLTKDQLRSIGIEYYEIERGGDVTYHGPGQIVVYPILNLNRYKKDVGWYMRTLETALITTLESFHVPAMQIPGRTGVWTDASSKIASIGVRISRWCTMHGLALNVSDQSGGFRHINPCGFKGINISYAEQFGAIKQEEMAKALIENLRQALIETSNPTSLQTSEVTG
ncbi:MAG: lipoyl(octanoyl) transferase LipB [Bdellovibrionales bacterium]|nr:lipoyl(octanoyl) transferase LipB [Bdellovibrionales bacterium]